MHDDEDDDLADDQGLLHFSGFNPHAERADYALPHGMPALQGGDIEFEREPETDQLRVSRRKFASICIGVALTGAGTTYAVLSSSLSSARSDTNLPPRGARSRTADWLIRGAREAATGSLDVLVSSYGTFIMVVQDYEQHDPVLWEGIDRLGKYALLYRGQKGIDIAQRLLGAFEHVAPPQHLANLRIDLEELVWRWNRKR